MKSRILIFLITGLLLYSCKKEEDSVTSTSGYTAKIDGKAWKASSIQASVYNGTIVVIARSSDGTIITFSLNGDSVAVYPVNESSNSSASFDLSSSSTNSFTSGGNSSAGGTVLIEDISMVKHKMTGSISFTAVRNSDDSTIEITEGRFVNITFDELPISVNENSLKAKVGGSSWAPQNVSGYVAFKTLYLQAVDADGIRKINFEIPELIGPGNYALNYFTNYKSLYINIAGKKHYAVNGSLEVVSHNLVSRQIEAKFEMETEAHEGGGIIDLTEGELNIIYE